MKEPTAAEKKRFAAQCDTMFERAQAWRKANAGRDVLIQFNYPPNVCVIAPISEAVKQHVVNTNAAGLELIKALWGWDDSSEPTVNMVRMVLEHVPRPTIEEATFPTKPAACPECGKILNTGTVAESFGQPVSKPQPGDISMCIECGAFAEFTENGFAPLREEVLQQLPQEALKMLYTAQQMVRDRAKNRGKS